MKQKDRVDRLRVDRLRRMHVLPQCSCELTVCCLGMEEPLPGTHCKGVYLRAAGRLRMLAMELDFMR